MAYNGHIIIQVRPISQSQQKKPRIRMDLNIIHHKHKQQGPIDLEAMKKFQPMNPFEKSAKVTMRLRVQILNQSNQWKPHTE